MSQVRMAKSLWQQILDKVRKYSGTDKPLTATQLPDLMDGKWQYATAVYGNDSRVFEVAIPFVPDAVCVYCQDVYAGAKKDTYRGFMAEMRTAGGYMGQVSYRKSDGTATSSAVGATTGLSTFTYADGVFRFELPAANIPTVIWRSNARYTVWAAHFPEENVKQLIIDQLERLPDEEGGTLTFSTKRINDLFTTEEWEALIATKPNWSFVLD